MKNKKLINSFKCAIQGIKQAVKTERNVKIHITIIPLFLNNNMFELFLKI